VTHDINCSLLSMIQTILAKKKTKLNKIDENWNLFEHKNKN